MEQLKQLSDLAMTLFLGYPWWIIIVFSVATMIPSFRIARKENEAKYGVNTHDWPDDAPVVDRGVAFFAGITLATYGLWILTETKGEVYAGWIATWGGGLTLLNVWESHSEIERKNLVTTIHASLAAAGGYFAQKFLAGPDASYFEKAPAYILGFVICLGFIRLSDPRWVVDSVLRRLNEIREHKEMSAEFRKWEDKRKSSPERENVIVGASSETETTDSAKTK